MAKLDLKMLWSPSALNIYAGAALGFYGSRALHTFAVTPLVGAIRGEKEATGLMNPDNWREVTDIVTASLLLMLAKDSNMKMGIMAGAGLSFIDHILDRFPDVAAKIPR